MGVWVAGFATEVIADRQKSQWRKEKDEKKHSEEWISRGLWGKSRHPNYFGEMLLWFGIWLVCISPAVQGVVVGRGAQALYASVLGPVFLTRTPLSYLYLSQYF